MTYGGDISEELSNQIKTGRIKVSLDRLSLVGGIDHDWQKEVWEIKKEQGLNNIKAPYKYFMQFDDNAYLQFGAMYEDMYPFRIDFNPNKCDVRTIKFIKENMKMPKVTRIDVAMDIEEDINKYFIIDAKGVTMNVYLDQNKTVNGVYLGSMKSDIMTRVYDKRKQLKRENTIIDHDLLRVEVQRRYKDGQGIEEILEADLFDRVILLEKTGKLEYRALLEYLTRHPECIGELTRWQKKKMRENMNQQNKLVLNEVYQAARDSLRQQVAFILKRGFLPVRESFGGEYYEYVQENYKFRVIPREQEEKGGDIHEQFTFLTS